MAIEKPKFKTLVKDGRFEIRLYEPFITSQVEVKADDYREAANRGFSPLANYIFGANISQQKISMTAPVSAAPSSEKIAMTSPVAVSGSGTYTVSFMIPSKYTLETLPTPTDRRVTFKQHPEKQVAVIKFSGRFSQPNFNKHLKLLEDWIKLHGYSAKGEAVIAGYDPPFTPWFMKRNEVQIEV